MKLPRPYIPLKIRVQVAAREARAYPGLVSDILSGLHSHNTDRQKLNALLLLIFREDAHLAELHHDPALMNRLKIRDHDGKIVGYKPAANDPNSLIYIIAADHDIVTRVRGFGAQLSDQGLQRKLKRMDENRGRRRRRPKVKIPQRANPWAKKPKKRRRRIR